MNAVLKPLEAQFEALTPAWLGEVVRVEKTAYDHPWTHGNFNDSLNAGYQAHLLNITVAPEHQRQGWARVMLDGLALWARGQGAQWLWLEVRVSNVRAKAVYEAYGFRHVGTRRNYYPNGSAAREDAVVMSLAL